MRNFNSAKKFLSYLPNSVYQLTEQLSTEDNPNRTSEWLIDAIPRDINLYIK